MSPPKICIVGDNCVDLYPVQTKKFVGGNGVNTAVAVQRNGIHCGYLGIVGNDEAGKLIIETLQKETIDCQRLRQTEGKTAWTIVHLEDGERIFFEDSLEVQRDFELEKKLSVSQRIRLGASYHFFQLEPGRKKSVPGL